MSNDNTEIKENEVKEAEVIEEPKAESKDDSREESKAEPKEEPKEESEKPVELDESDDGLEAVDLNATDYGKTYKGSIPEKNYDDQVEISLSGKKNSNSNRVDDDSEEEHRPVRRREKKPVDQYKKKRVRKRIRVFVILAILIILALLLYFKGIKPAKEAAEAMLTQMTEQTDTVEKRDITESITTTGTIEASAVRTLTSTAKDTTIDAVMADVGDMVKEGDTLVMFSTENINKTIEQLQEDLAKQKRKDAIDSKASDRNYLYTYANQSVELSNAAEKVNTTLKDLYEACDGYGTAKRKLQDAKDSGESEAVISQLEASVASAYQREQQAQVTYDDAVNAQAQLIARSGNTLTEADENKQKNAITAGDQATNISRQIEDYQDKLENYVITAPISGLVTSVSVEEGNGFAGGTVMVIQDTDTLKITTKIDEYDIPNIKLGQRVVIKTDATRDDELIGYVSFIAPTSTTMATGGATSTAGSAVTNSQSSSGASFEVTITIITKDERLRIGMSAKLNIIVDQVSNVFTVPYDAIQTNAQGENYITIIDEKGGKAQAQSNDAKDSGMPVLQVNGENVSDNGNNDKKDFNNKMPGFGKGGPQNGPDAANENRRDIIVTIGMEGDYYTQIISDELEEGMTVIIPDSGQFGGFDFGSMMNGGGPR